MTPTCTHEKNQKKKNAKEREKKMKTFQLRGFDIGRQRAINSVSDGTLSSL
jgi:hypothetical protein